MRNEDAEREAFLALTDRNMFKCVERPADPRFPFENMAPSLRKIFSRFEKIEEVNGEFCLDRTTVTESSVRSGFLKIGADFGDSEIVVRPGRDEVFIVHNAEHPLEPYPTIYHLILLSRSE
jgi:hypothetical protein